MDLTRRRLLRLHCPLRGRTERADAHDLTLPLWLLRVRTTNPRRRHHLGRVEQRGTWVRDRAVRRRAVRRARARPHYRRLRR